MASAVYTINSILFADTRRGSRQPRRGVRYAIAKRASMIKNVKQQGSFFSSGCHLYANTGVLFLQFMSSPYPES